MDWTSISIAGAAMAMLMFLVGHRFGRTSGYIIGYQHGVLKAEEECMRAIDNWLKRTKDAMKVKLNKEDKDYLQANVAQLDKTIEECGPEDVVNKQSLESHRDAIKSVIAEQEEKSNV